MTSVCRVLLPRLREGWQAALRASRGRGAAETFEAAGRHGTVRRVGALHAARRVQHSGECASLPTCMLTLLSFLDGLVI